MRGLPNPLLSNAINKVRDQESRSFCGAAPELNHMETTRAIAIAETIMNLRGKTIIGRCIDMVPYAAEHDEEVVQLRALPNVRYFMNLIDEPSHAGQAAWREGYERRFDDIMWVIHDKFGRACGTNRLYEITDETAEKGSLIVHPDVSRILPAALESEVTVIDTAFNLFEVKRVITQNREDNTNMISMNEKLGFLLRGESTIRGAKYLQYELSRDAWNPAPFRTVIDHWARRFS